MNNHEEPSDEDSTQEIMIEGHTIHKKLDKILERTASIETKVAIQENRLAMVERLIYGGAGLALTSVVVGVLALVIRK